jgi:hypothetical protein
MMFRNQYIVTPKNKKPTKKLHQKDLARVVLSKTRKRGIKAMKMRKEKPYGGKDRIRRPAEQRLRKKRRRFGKDNFIRY